MCYHNTIVFPPSCRSAPDPDRSPAPTALTRPSAQASLRRHPLGNAGRGRAAALGWSGLLSKRYRWPSCTERSGSGARPAVRIFIAFLSGVEKIQRTGGADNSGGNVLWSKTTKRAEPPYRGVETGAPRCSLIARAFFRGRGPRHARRPSAYQPPSCVKRCRRG